MSVLGVPLLREGVPIGAIALHVRWRRYPPATLRALRVLTTATICHARAGGLLPSDPQLSRVESLRLLKGSKRRVMDGIENQAWTKADRVFLADALARGMSTAEVAAFLGRTEDEVRGQCEALRLPRRPPAQDS
jgi:hypothetical protein